MSSAAYANEEWSLEQLIWDSGHICSDCGEELHLTDEVFLIQAIYVAYDENGQPIPLILSADDGGYLYEPQFLHTACWESLWEDFWNEHGGTDPCPDPEGQLQVAECYGCTSPIRAHELSAQLNLGELHCSKRLPDGEPTIHFEPNPNTELVCIECLLKFNGDIFEMWDDLEVPGVCNQGVRERCWRYGQCQLGCRYLLGAVE